MIEFGSLDTWSKIATIVEAIAVTGGAAFTILTVNAWRTQNIGKRKVELGEQALLDFYEVADILAFVRERLAVPEGVKPIDAFQAKRSEYYNRLMTLEGLDGPISSLVGQRPMFRVYFGADAGAPFDSIIKITRALQADARELFVNVPAQGTLLQDRTALLNAIGWGDTLRPDSIDSEIAKAVAGVEAICKPVLQGQK